MSQLKSRPAKIPLKVHRVATIEEVQTLEEAGVEYIGFHVDEEALWGMDKSPFWADERYLSLEQLGELLGAVKRAHPVVECSHEAVEEVRKQTKRFDTTLIQLNSFSLPADSWLAEQREKGVEFIYGYQYVVPGDDRRFLGMTSRKWPSLFAIDLQIFPSEQDAWNLLSAPNPELVKDIVLKADIEKLAQAVPLFVSLNFTVENSAPIAAGLSALPIKGLSFTLSPAKYGSFHTFEFEDASRIIRLLRAR